MRLRVCLPFIYFILSKDYSDETGIKQLNDGLSA